MKAACCICVGMFIAASVVSAQNPAPTGAPPKFQVVSETIPDKGEIIVSISHLVVRAVPVQKVVVINGVQTVVNETVYVTEQRIERTVYNAAKSRIINRDGKQLPIDEVWKRLKPNTVIAVSGDLATPSTPFLRALAPETLILIPPSLPMQPQIQGVRVPAPPVPKVEPIPPPLKN